MNLICQAGSVIVAGAFNPTMKEFTPGRKTLHHMGMVVTGIGLVLFLSVFVSGAMHFGDFARFEERNWNQFTAAVVGMILIGAGLILRRLAARAGLPSAASREPSMSADRLDKRGGAEKTPADAVAGNVIPFELPPSPGCAPKSPRHAKPRQVG